MSELTKISKAIARAAYAKGRSDLVTELLEVFIRPRPNGGVAAVMSAIRDAAKEKEGRNT